MYIIRIIENKAYKYGIDIYSVIIVRYAPISIKVDNPDFSDNRKEIRDFMTKKKISHRFLSNKYVPFFMDYEKYGSITNRYTNENNENVIVVFYNKNYLHIIKNYELLENNVQIYNENNNLIDSFVDPAFEDYFI